MAVPGKRIQFDEGENARNRYMLQDEKCLELYVEMRNIPAGETSNSLKVKLFDMSLPIVNPTLVYCDGSDTAVLICDSEKDAVYLSKNRDMQFEFRRMKEKCHSGIISKLDATLWNIAKRSIHFRAFSDKLKQIHVTVIDEDIPIIKSDTTYQINCARAMLAQFDTKEITKASDGQDSKRADSFNFYEKVVLENVSSDVWRIVSEQAKDDIRLFENDFGKFEYSPKQKSLTIPIYRGHSADAFVEKVKNRIEYLKSNEILEISLDFCRVKNSIQTRCKDVEEAIGYPCIVLVDDGSKVLAFAETYEQLMFIKHQVLLKLGLLKATARRRGNRVASDTHGNGSTMSTIISTQNPDHGSVRGNKKK